MRRAATHVRVATLDVRLAEPSGTVMGGVQPSGDLPRLVVPVPVPQLTLEDLAGARQRQGVDELETARNLVACDALPHVSAQLLLGGPDVACGQHHGVHAFPPPWIRDA